jgi:hypothetical protein
MEYDEIFLFLFLINFLIGKLAAFYFFFYIALGGFFCLYLSIFMSLLPLNQPRYIGNDSLLTSRANPLSPGFFFFCFFENKIDFIRIFILFFQDLVVDHKLLVLI